MTNKLFELVAKRRSVRRYTKDHISDDDLKEIMKVALAAPCSFGHREEEEEEERRREERRMWEDD